MLVYRCKSRFLCSALGKYIPVGATVARYENAIRIVVNFDPNGVVKLDAILRDGICYEDPKYVQWFYGVEPPPNGTFTGGIFEYVLTEWEDAYGNVCFGGGGGGTQGTQGSQGNQGAIGTAGVGNQGFQGNQGVGNQGFQGNQGVGNQGFQGNQGPQGYQGTFPSGAFLNDLGNNNVRQKNDGTMQFWDYGTSKWRTPVLTSGVLGWDAGE